VRRPVVVLLRLLNGLPTPWNNSPWVPSVVQEVEEVSSRSRLSGRKGLTLSSPPPSPAPTPSPTFFFSLTPLLYPQKLRIRPISPQTSLEGASTATKAVRLGRPCVPPFVPSDRLPTPTAPSFQTAAPFSLDSTPPGRFPFYSPSILTLPGDFCRSVPFAPLPPPPVLRIRIQR